MIYVKPTGDITQIHDTRIAEAFKQSADMVNARNLANAQVAYSQASVRAMDSIQRRMQKSEDLAAYNNYTDFINNLPESYRERGAILIGLQFGFAPSESISYWEANRKEMERKAKEEQAKATQPSATPPPQGSQ